MTRTDRIRELTRLFNEISPMARYFGMKLSFTEDGNAVVDLPYNPNLDNLQRLVHGGVFATLLDIAGGFTAALSNEERCFVATTEMSCTLSCVGKADVSPSCRQYAKIREAPKNRGNASIRREK